MIVGGTSSSRQTGLARYLSPPLKPKYNMYNIKSLQAFCSGDYSQIENFREAALDPTMTWDIHHRRETDELKSMEQLKAEGLYFNRPPEELIFLTPVAHHNLHAQAANFRKPMLGRHHSEESRRKLSETRRARIASGEIKVDTSACHTEEANKKISDKAKERYSDKSNHPMYGKHCSEETRRKISDANTGRNLTEEHKKKISEGVRLAMTDEVKEKISQAAKGNTHVRGKHWKCKPRTKPAWNKGKKMSEEQKEKLRKPKSDEHKRNIGLSRIGLHWFNDGQSNRLFRDGEEPVGWVRGRK